LPNFLKSNKSDQANKKQQGVIIILKQIFAFYNTFGIYIFPAWKIFECPISTYFYLFWA